MKKGKIILLVSVFVIITIFAVSLSAAPSVPKMNLKNKVVKILSWTGPEGFPELIELFKKFYGGEIDWTVVDSHDITTKLTAMVMSGDSPDIVRDEIQKGRLFWLWANNLVQPANDYIDVNSPFWSEMKYAMDQFKLKGKYYPVIYGMNKSYLMIFYNKTIFENNGLDTPLDYYNRGEWDWNTLKDLAIQLTQDTDGDGNIDSWGFLCDKDFGLAAFALSTGKHIINMSSEGKLSSNLWDPDVVRASDFLRSLTSAEHNCMRPRGNSKELKEFINGQDAMMLARYYRLKDYKAMYDEIGWVPMPKDPKADKYYTLAYPNYGFFVTGSKNPTGAAALFNTFRYIELDEKMLADRSARLVEEGQYSKECRTILDTIAQEGKTPVVPYYFTVDDFNNFRMYRIWMEMYNGQNTYETTVEKYMPQLQANIDQFNALVK